MAKPTASASARRAPAASAGAYRPAAPPARRAPAASAGAYRPAAPPARHVSTTPSSARRPASAPALSTASEPVGQLKTNRGLLKLILLSGITLGFYGFAVMYTISSDINIIAFRYDGRKTMNYCLLFFLIGPLTLGIGHVAWLHRVSSRIGRELRRRRIPYGFGATDYWLWNVLGAFILVGPFIYLHKLFKAMNKLCEHYNMNG